MELHTVTIGGGPLPEGIQANNFVKTTRYTVLSFIPLTILENFKRLANIYFLAMALIGFLPWSPIAPIFQVFPLVVVIAISMIKSGIEDLLRYSNDRKNNSQLFEVFRDRKFRKIPSGDIRPGELVWIQDGTETPVDLLIFSTSHPAGHCFANEVNLNGETAIKQKKAIFASEGLSPSESTTIEGTIQIPFPCKDIQKLDGTINRTAFSIKNCMLRGVHLQHTDWIIGAALYTGHDTRIIQNQRHPPHKTSHLETKLNLLIAFDFALNIALVLFLSIMGTIKEGTLKFAWVNNSDVNISLFLSYFAAYAILMSYMIPVSLYVAIEFVRIFQRWTFSVDLDMFSPELGYCKPNNSNLNEELGQIDHVFSDKTGTLTENIMRFVKFYADNVEVEVDENLDLKDDSLELMKCLAICSNVIVTESGYNAESPDEGALVYGAACAGVMLEDRIDGDKTLVIIGEDQVSYDNLAVVEFSSDRKRMSVIVRTPEGKIVMYTKGADTAVLPLVTATSKDAAQPPIDNLLPTQGALDMVDDTLAHVDAFAREGLRTLICAKREIAEDEFEEWYKRYVDAAETLEGREVRVANVGAEIEHGLTLLGAVAIEDELQPEVPSTIAYLARMGIGLWILTGDKKETAISIARSTNVILSSSPVIELLKFEDVEETIQHLNGQKKTVVVIEPTTLAAIIENKPESLVQIGENSRSIVCFRMSPFLKSQVVHTMRTLTTRVCLAIGDGANDVNMIQTAHVGVGIFGREGHQAAGNSDFAITRFKHLKKLLAVHGRLSLLRISGCILYMIYKNLILILPQVYFSFSTNWTPTTIYDSMLLSTYNLVWTIFPPVEYGWFEQDISFSAMLHYPYLYHEVRAGRYLSSWRFALEFFNAVYQSIVLYMFCVYLPSQTITNMQGMTHDFWSASLLLFLSVVMIANLQSVIRSHAWNVYLFLGVYLSVFVFFLLILPYGALSTYAPSMYFIPQVTFTNYIPYIIVVFCVVASLAPEALFRFLKALWFPSYSRITREIEQIGKDSSIV